MVSGSIIQDFILHSGETIGVIGGTGSGKSSLVNLICRLYDVDEGCVRVQDYFGRLDFRILTCKIECSALYSSHNFTRPE